MNYVGGLTAQSAAYVVSYVVKGLTGSADVRLKGLKPEFARMSLKPGIGAGAVTEIGRALTTKGGSASVAINGDVPGCIRIGGKRWPLGRYLKGKCRESVGMDKDAARQVLDMVAGVTRDNLMEPGAVAAKEGKRVQSARRAAVLDRLSRSRKGIGV